MKIIHTSDWHLGRHLHGRKRYEAFKRFLEWMKDYIKENEIQVLLISGDIFDTNTPSNTALELYYQFLGNLINSVCRHIIIIAGNHDSPALLNAPKELLRYFNIHVIGSISDDISDEIIEVKDHAGITKLIVCAVPFLRDRDIRCAEAGESIQDKEKKMLEGIKNHYEAVCVLANQRRNGAEIPVIVMGHLFTAGGKVVEDDGVRELYIGSLAHVHHQIFSEEVDYVALGHLHVPQKVAQSEKIRYSGSPLAMGFGETRQRKIVCLLETEGKKVNSSEITLPVFQQLESIRGDKTKILQKLEKLVLRDEEILAEVIYTGEEIWSDFKTIVESIVSGSKMDVVRTKNMRTFNAILQKEESRETLDELSKEEVFKRCLTANQISQEEQAELNQTFSEAITLLDDPEYQDSL
jgi:exonuclease SbcD